MQTYSLKGRDYQLQTLGGREPVPLVVCFHGFTHDAGKMRALTSPDGRPEHPESLESVAREQGFAIAFPNGTPIGFPWPGRAWNGGGGTGGYAPVAQPAVKRDVDDVTWFLNLLNDIQARSPISRVFVTGLSNGAAMAQRLAMEAADSLQAVAAVAGANQHAATVGREGDKPVLHIHGTKDPIWPYYGCTLPKLGRMRAVPESVEGWAHHRGKAEVTVLHEPSRDDPTQVVREVREQVELYRIEGGGHTWPGGHQYMSRKIVGSVCRHFNASRLIWDFFKRYA